MKHKLIVGLPAKNEETSIYGSLKSIAEAVLYSGVDDYKIVICTNDCSDGTAEVAKKFIYDHKNIDCILVESQLGLINAQRKIVSLFPADIYVFPDADSNIERESIKLLLDELNKNSETVVAYAKTISLTDSKTHTSLAEKIGILYDSQELLSPRNYIHGRLFATKHWFIPEDKDVMKAANASRSGREMLKYCRRGFFLAVDDIFMSSYIMNKYGLNSIKQIDSARCFSWPVASFSDWLHVYRRSNIEMEKMKRWFSEYNYLLPHLSRRTNWSSWFKAKWSNKLLWLIYLTMKDFLFVYLKLELLLLKIGLYVPPTQWNITKTTKKSNNLLP